MYLLEYSFVEANSKDPDSIKAVPMEYSIAEVARRTIEVIDLHLATVNY